MDQFEKYLQFQKEVAQATIKVVEPLPAARGRTAKEAYV